MHQIINLPIRRLPSLRILLLGLSWVVSSHAMMAENFCALTLDVVTWEGKPSTVSWVELLDSSGRRVLTKEILGPTVRICDFGFGRHTLRVGTKDCLPVSIENLQVVFGKPLHLKVIRNHCGYQHSVRNACLLYLRAVDNDGRPVEGAELSLWHPPGAPHKTDSYGRFQILYPGNQDIVVTKEGFEAAKVRAECKETEELDIKVVMEKAKKE